ncbi:hypothetical protein C0Q70_03022 [Pomacea canaliculata]|uniref:Carbohydrate sulfotransferase n=1 Tax=Pomacea canaliculata TaxID=400727 RepID=A0A2T7PRJ7_POMCA|nr:hypothetical protein C0Q70_03022 [Pomacea canaliculata]
MIWTFTSVNELTALVSPSDTREVCVCVAEVNKVNCSLASHWGQQVVLGRAGEHRILSDTDPVGTEGNGRLAGLSSEAENTCLSELAGRSRGCDLLCAALVVSEASSICITKGRRLRMLHYCLPFTNNSLQLRFVDSRVPVISVEHRYLHCPVAKAASTFWVRFMKVLNETGASPFRVALDQRTSVRRNIQTLRDLASREEKLDFLKSATKAVFVRDPYSRMFSAWVDKAFTPNPFYWTVWGAEAIHTFRKRATSKESFCGSDVTFAEVMALAASGTTFVGKMETFGRDLNRLITCLNVSNKDYFRSKEFRQDYVRDAIEDSVNSPWSWLANITKCMSISEAAKRVWRKLQIRGIISRRFPFPFTEMESSSLLAGEFIEAALSAHRRSTDKDELKTQKEEAMMEAYSTVDSNVLLKLRGVFREDFEMFGYSSTPPGVFDTSSNVYVKKGAFRWDTEWV